MRDEAGMQLAAARETADRDTSELRAALQQLQQDSNRLTQQHHTLMHEKTCLTAERQTLEQLLRETQRENAVLAAKNDGLAQQLTERESRVAELQQLNRQMQGNLEHYRESSLEQRQRDAARHEQEKQQLEQTAIQFQTQLADLQQKYGNLHHDHDKLAHAESFIQERLGQAVTRYEESRATHVRLKAEHAE